MPAETQKTARFTAAGQLLDTSRVGHDPRRFPPCASWSAPFPSLIKRRSINSRRGKTTGTAWRAAKTTGRIAILGLDPAQLFEPVERNLNHIVWSIIAGQSKYGVNDSISRVCNEPPDNVDIDSRLRTQRR